MNKTLTLATLALAISVSTFAQDGTTTKSDKTLSFQSKRGHEVLPQAGDWSLGISATSFLNYMGNLANNSTTNNAPTINAAGAPDAFALGNIGSGYAVTAKYMKSADLAYRVRFQANLGSNTYRNMVMANDTAISLLNPKFTEDKAKVSSTAVLLGAGFEKRRGSGRLQGFYGAEVIIGFASGSTTYTYGNKMDSMFLTPTTTTDFNTGSTSDTGLRVTEKKNGSTFMAGVRGFAGVEYFFAPKISLGGELGYTLGFSTNGKSTTTYETWDPTSNKAASITVDGYKSAGLQSIGMGLDKVNASINLNFYF